MRQINAPGRGLAHLKPKEATMQLGNTRTAYGWIAIALHWISAVGVIVLYFLGDTLEEAVGRPAKAAAYLNHVSVGVLLFTFLAARLIWSATQSKPAPLETRKWFALAAKVVAIAFLAMIAIQIITGPLIVWSGGRALQVFDWFAIPSPFPQRIGWLREAAELPHKLAPNLFWPLLILHVGGALKHVVIDRDKTLLRMLWVSKS